MTHYLKTWPEFFQAVKSNIKLFEMRKADRAYAVGDTLVLQEYDPKAREYTGDEISRKVTYMLYTNELPLGDVPLGRWNEVEESEKYVIMSIKEG